MKKIALVILCAFPSIVLADPWHNNIKITHLYPAIGGLNFLVDKPLIDYSSCNRGKRFSVRLDHKNYDVMVSTLMMAFALGKSININLNAIETPICSPSINRLLVVK